MNRSETDYTKKSLISKTIHLAINALIFLAIYALSRTSFQQLYLFEWTSRNYYLFVWIFVIIFIVKGYYKSGYLVSLTNVFAIFFGQYLGDFIRNNRMKEIAPGIDPELAYKLSRHDGWWIWLVLIILSVIIGYIIGRRNDYVD